MDQHAVRKQDEALALGTGSSKRNKSGVAGRGQWKTWTINMMLRASPLVCIYDSPFHRKSQACSLVYSDQS